MYDQKQSPFLIPPAADMMLEWPLHAEYYPDKKRVYYREKMERNPEYLSYCYSPQIMTCMEVFVDEELAVPEHTNKGIGRLTGFIPRFGAYYREQMAGANSETRTELKRLMFTMIRSGYDCAILYEWDRQDQLNDPGQLDLSQQFASWVVTSYHATEKRVGERVWKRISNVANALYHDFLPRLREWGFPCGFFKRLKLSSIVFHYVLAGYLLRHFELDAHDRELELQEEQLEQANAKMTGEQQESKNGPDSN